MFAHPRTLSALLLVSAVACQGLWDGLTRPNDKNCIPNPALCIAPQSCNQSTGECEDPSSPEVVWAVGTGGRVLRRRPEGTWGVVTGANAPTAAQTIYGVWGTSAEDVWMVGSKGARWHYVAGTWTVTTDGFAQDLYAIWGSDANNLWAVGGLGTFIKYDGTSWSAPTNSTCSPSDLLAGVWGTQGGTVWAVGRSQSSICAWTGTTTRSESCDGYSGGFSAVFGGSASEVWAAGNSTSVCHRKDGVWRVYSPSGSGQYRGIWGTSATDLWFASQTKADHWDGAWSAAVFTVPIVPINAISGNRAGKFWMVGTEGIAVRWDGAPPLVMELGPTPTVGNLNGVWAVP